MEKTQQRAGHAVLWALLAAALYAISTPVSKLLLQDVAPTMMAGLLYLGAGTGMFVLGVVRRGIKQLPREQHLTRRDLPYTVGMVLLDIAAPMGTAINAAHQTPGLSFSLHARNQLVQQLKQVMEELGKRVTVTYY